MSRTIKAVAVAGGCLAVYALFAIVRSETVDVKYRGPVNLAPFACDDYSRSSLVTRVCYDKTSSYMIISLNGTYYHYCGIDVGTVEALKAADSMGRYYNGNIRGRFDCRTNPVPEYR